MDALYPKVPNPFLRSKKYLLFLVIVLFSRPLFAQPVVTSFTPASGASGSTVTISGSGFGATTGSNIVYFGDVRATVTAASSTSLTVTVPVSASYSPISVTTAGLIGISRQCFDPIFSGTRTIDSSFFAAHADSTAGNSPYSVTHVDIDGDGKPDLVVVSGGYPYTVSLYRNTSTPGSITFAPPIGMGAAATAYGSVVGDVDGDGKPDLVVANAGGYLVYIYRNLSTPGTFAFSTPAFIVSGDPYIVALGDLDGDGRLDLVLTDFIYPNMAVYRNTSTPGNISFGGGKAITTGNGPFGVTIGDLDGDGKPDVVVANETDNTVSVFKNNSSVGTISLGARTDIPVGTGPTRAAIVDVDGDGKPDLAVAEAGIPSSVSILKNTSVPGTITFAARVDFATAAGPSWIEAGDLDGDGKPDLAVSAEAYDSVSVLQNESSSGSIAFSPSVSWKTGSAPWSIGVVDLDGDGRPDIVTADEAANDVSILRNLGVEPSINSFSPTFGGTGTADTIRGENFTGATGVSFGGTAATSFKVLSAGVIVAVVGPGATGGVMITTAAGSCSRDTFTYYPAPVITSFSPASALPGATVTITGNNFTGTTAVSFGGVPASSFVVVNATTITAVINVAASGNVMVTTPGGTATKGGFVFAVPTITAFSPVQGPAGTVVTITGTNFSTVPGNNTVYFGAALAVVTSASTTQLTVSAPNGATYQPITIVTNGLTAYSVTPFAETVPGGGQLTDSSFASPVIVNTGAGPSDLKMMDLDGDGKPDFAIPYQGASSYAPNGISISRNVSTPGIVDFIFHSDILTSQYGSFPQSVGFGDFDGDGKPDMAVPNDGASNILVYRNTSTSGTISFGAAQPFPGGQAPSGVAVGDLNGDGKPDIVFTNFYDNNLYVMVNTTVGQTISFAAPIPLTTGEEPNVVAIGDIDGDGKPDIVVANMSQYTRYVSVFHNTTSGGVTSFAPEVEFSPLNSALVSEVGLADMNGDGKLDMVVVSTNGVDVFRNLSTPGSITFGAPTETTYPGSWQSFSIGDIDGDGRPDVVVADMLNTTLIFQNTSVNGSISLAAPHAYPINSRGTTALFVGDVDGDGRADLSVAQSGGATDYLVYRNIMSTIPKPQLDSVTPDTAMSGTTITITGHHFTGVTAVSLGGVPAGQFAVVNDSVITAVVGPGATGFVKVSSAGGTDSLAGFVYEGTKLLSFTPDSASAGMSVTIRGIFLTGATTVSFGGVPAASFSVLSDTVISAVVGSGASGRVAVAAPAGQDSLPGFVFIPADTSTTATTPIDSAFQLIQFSGTPSGSQMALTWQVRWDRTIMYYVLERASDSLSFTPIGSVQSKGTDSTLQTYSFVDPQPLQGASYYRLTTEDTADHFVYRDTIGINVGNPALNLFIQPNPADSYVRVSIPDISQPSQLELVDMAGRVVTRVQVAQNVQQVNMATSTLDRGVYYLVWSNGASHSFRLLLIMRK